MSLLTVKFEAHALGYASGDIVTLDQATDGLRAAIAQSYAAVTAEPTNREPTEEHAEMRSLRASLAPFRVAKSGAWTITGSGLFAWTDTDPLGSPAARPLDMLLYDCEPGDWVRVTIDMMSVDVANAALFDVFFIVNGVASGNHLYTSVNPFAAPQGFVFRNGVYVLSQTISGQLQAADIDAQGNVRLRLRHWANTGVSKIISDANSVVTMEATGPFGPRPSI